MKCRLHEYQILIQTDFKNKRKTIGRVLKENVNFSDLTGVISSLSLHVRLSQPLPTSETWCIAKKINIEKVMISY